MSDDNKKEVPKVPTKELIESIKSWVSVDDKIFTLNNEIKHLKNEKKDRVIPKLIYFNQFQHYFKFLNIYDFSIINYKPDITFCTKLIGLSTSFLNGLT